MTTTMSAEFARAHAQIVDILPAHAFRREISGSGAEVVTWKWTTSAGEWHLQLEQALIDGPNRRERPAPRISISGTDSFSLKIRATDSEIAAVIRLLSALSAISVGDKYPGLSLTAVAQAMIDPASRF